MMNIKTLHLIVLLYGVLCHGSPGAVNPGCREKVADVVFLLDSSFSIWEEQFQTQLAFVQHLVDVFAIGPNHIRVGVVTFSSVPRLDVALNQYMTKEDLRHAIGQIPYMIGGTTTGDAIRFLHSDMFTEERGSRLWAAHLAILITDGQSDDRQQTALEASIARSKGIELLAIGVGQLADQAELRAVASDPDNEHVFHVESYEALEQIESLVAKKACHRTDGTGSGGWDDLDTAKDAAVKRCAGKTAELYFLLDSSSSIERDQYREEGRFVTHLLHLLDLRPDATRVGVAIFSDDVRDIVTLDQHQSPHSVKKALRKMTYLAGGTNTALALHHARTQGLAAAREDAARVIILLTDGQSENATQALQEAREAREEGMAVFAVGIGSHTDMVELMGVASDPDENFVFRVDSFGGLENIRELLAIKTCDVPEPDVQGEQATPDCQMDTPTDVLFLYDLASVSRAESEAISDQIRQLVSRMETQASAPDLLHYGLLRQNCHTGHGVDLKTGARADELHELLQRNTANGLHTLLQKARLHGYLRPFEEDGSRSSSGSRQEVVVLFIGGKLADSSAVEREVRRLLFLQVRVLVVAVDEARSCLTTSWSRLPGVVTLGVESYTPGLRLSRDDMWKKWCEVITQEG